MKRLLSSTILAASIGFSGSVVASPSLEELSDRMALADIPTQIEQAVDRKDWDHARSFFTDEIHADFTSLAGGEPMTIPADALIAGWSENLKGNKESLHMRGAPIITIQGDNATAVSNGYAWNKMPGGPEGEGDIWEVWGTYTHGFVRTGTGWKVNAFTFDATHERGSNWVKITPGSTE